MSRTVTALLLSSLLAGCAASAPPAPAKIAKAPASPAAPGKASSAPATTPEKPALVAAAGSEEPKGNPNGPWIGAAGASEFVLAGQNDTLLGVWVDVPSAGQKTHSPAAVSLVVDTSGSMSGDKIQNARAAARAFVDKLSDGDIVSILAFSDSARQLVSPVVLDATSRARIKSAISELGADGGTNIFEGLRNGESLAFRAPQTHPIRRVVLISDGQATVGPTSNEILGELAQRGADHGIQVTSLGVGLDYDENTLNTLAVRSSGRLYHLSDSREMASMLEKEIALLQATAATGAFVEIVPAPGVQLLGVDGQRADWNSGSLRVPLGTMFGGQHREMLVRVRVNASGDGQRPLASVRFHFQDPSDGNIERVQEVVARYNVTSDQSVIAKNVNEKTQVIAANVEAAKVTMDAAKQLNDGDFAAAEQKLATAEAKFRSAATKANTAKDKARALHSADQIASVRQATRAAAASPAAGPPKPAAKRARALEANKAAMDAYGF